MDKKQKKGLGMRFAFWAIPAAICGLMPLVAGAQTVVTWDASDTDAVVSPAFTGWKTYIKWFLILAIPILIALYFLGRVLGIFQGRH